jgi:hypothetical protein
MLANTLVLLKYKFVNSVTFAVVKNFCNTLSVIFASPNALPLPPDVNDCENIRALVIIFPDFFSIIYINRNFGLGAKLAARYYKLYLLFRWI